MNAQPIIGVIGLGTMGLGIAQVFAQAGHVVIATDAVPAARANAVERMADALTARLKAGKMTADDATQTLARVTIVDDLAAMSPCLMIIEAIAEDTAAKHALFAAVEAAVPATTLLATNTSSLSVTTIAAACRHPARMFGLHFFNPAPAMKLVELIPHPGTAPFVTDVAAAITTATGKTVITAPDSPGFIVNRCARPFYGEALALLAEGRTTADIDAAMLAAGYRIGPFALIDLIGADIHLAATEGLSAAMHHHPRYHVFAPLRAGVVAGRLGRKSGAGFIHPGKPGPTPNDAPDIALRIEAAMINEAASLHAMGVPTANIDAAMTLGMNWPQGPFALLRHHGAPAVLAQLAACAAAAPGHLQSRYMPTAALEKLA